MAALPIHQQQRVVVTWMRLGNCYMYCTALYCTVLYYTGLN